MALLIKPLRCPHCQQPIDKPLLKRHGQLKTFLQRKAFPCPHCGQSVVLPELSETMISVGILIAAILAPLFHLWDVSFIDSRLVFATGAMLVIAGVATQKLHKA